MEPQHPLFEELRLLLQDLSDQRARFASTTPPTFLPAQASELPAAELAARPAVDYAIQDWLDYGQWRGELSEATCFWLWARFEQAFFLLGSLTADNGSGQVPCLPVDDTGLHLVPGLMEWLLIHSWHFVGAGHWCSHLAWISDLLRDEKNKSAKRN
jgi:hypothetical protein